MPNSASVSADIKKIQADEAQLAADTAALAADAAASVAPPITVGASTLTAAVTGASVSLSATIATNATGYGFLRDGTSIESGTSRTYTDKNAAVGTHKYQVQPFAANVEGPLSAAVSVTVASVAPPANKATFTASVTSATEITVYWTNVTPLTVGRNGVDSNGYGAYTSPTLTTAQVAAGNWPFESLVPGDTYTFTLTDATGVLTTVRALTAASVTPPPPPVTGTNPAYPPAGVALGDIIFDSGFENMPNGELNSPYWVNTWGGSQGTMNNAITDPANVQIVDGKLVLTLSSASDAQYPALAIGATCATKTGSGQAATGFTYTGGLRETVLIVPESDACWWAVWQGGDNWPTDGEGDNAENLYGKVTSSYHWEGNGGEESISGIVWPNQPAPGEQITVTALWEPGVSYKIWCNGVLQATMTTSGVVDVDEFLIHTIGAGEGDTTVVGAQLTIVSDRVWPLATASDELGSHLLGE